MGLTGEWWISDGSATYADGDVGDMNHEAHVIEHVRHTVCDKMGYHHYDGDSPWEDVLRLLAEAIYSDNSELYEEAWLDKDWLGVIEDAWRDKGVTQDEWSIANDFNSADARQYASETLGWKRVDDNRVETWTLTEDDINSILDGLWEIDPELTDDTDVFIVVLSANSRCLDLTIGELTAMSKGMAASPAPCGVDLENQAATNRGRDDALRSQHKCYTHLGD
jgi:hypothetical protein